MGDMSDMYDYDYDPWDYEEEPCPQTCIYCGKKNLFWTEFNRVYRLASNNGIEHNCLPLKPTGKFHYEPRGT